MDNPIPPPSRDDPFIAIENFRMRLITAILNAAVVIVLVAFVVVVVASQ